MGLIKNQGTQELQMNELKNIEKDVNSFYDSIESSDIIEEIKKEDITRFIEKLVILEKRSKSKKRMVKIYYKLIGLL